MIIRGPILWLDVSPVLATRMTDHKVRALQSSALGALTGPSNTGELQSLAR